MTARGIPHCAVHFGFVLPCFRCTTPVIDALRRLPVIATCGDCGWHRPSNTRKAPDLCAHRGYPGLAHALPPLGPSGAPPDECPLRGAT